MSGGGGAGDQCSQPGTPAGKTRHAQKPRLGGCEDWRRFSGVRAGAENNLRKAGVTSGCFPIHSEDDGEKHDPGRVEDRNGQA